MALTYLRVYFDHEKAWEALSDAECGRLLKAALKYAVRREPPQLPGNERYQWPLIQSQIDREQEHFADISKKRSNAAKGSHATNAAFAANAANAEKTIQDNTIHNKTRQDKMEGTAFTPPTREEVIAYARERNSPVDPDFFFDFFDPDWVDSKGTPVRRWKQKFVTWEKAERQRQAEKKAKEEQEPDLRWFYGDDKDK